MNKPGIKKILIANRGEIAVRVIRSARELGMSTVAIYSDPDRDLLHVKLADEAVALGGKTSAETYLDIRKIIDAARKVKADAVHPGYGFLSENAEFAEEVRKNGIIFIGPSSSAIRTMGSKISAKQAVEKYDVPLVPGTDKPVKDPGEAEKIASEIGFPVLVKASAGGGGKGMRIVHKKEELKDTLLSAISEAESAFGDGSVFIEKYILSPRHIEIQVLGDNHGNIVHLFERECSVQRRYQKVIEEAPSAKITPEIRKQIGAAAVNVARSCDYTGAGTVEFIMDQESNFYFLEMNTRLQVEHPVTEMITGVDLVKEQIRVAEGASLSFSQEDLHINGHALELRVYAEDPAGNFLPSTGELKSYRIPSGPGVRVDHGVGEGNQISVYYDPMIAKLISWGKDRNEAIRRMERALEEYIISGVETTIPFGQYTFRHEAFLSGNYDTHFVQDHFDPDSLRTTLTRDEESLAAVFAVSLSDKKKKREANIFEGSKEWKRRSD